ERQGGSAQKRDEIAPPHLILRRLMALDYIHDRLTHHSSVDRCRTGRPGVTPRFATASNAGVAVQPFVWCPSPGFPSGKLPLCPAMCELDHTTAGLPHAIVTV